jgi:hypothetical protein
VEIPTPTGTGTTKAADIGNFQEQQEKHEVHDSAHQSVTTKITNKTCAVMGQRHLSLRYKQYTGLPFIQC